MKKSLITLIILSGAAQMAMTLPNINDLTKDTEIMTSIIDTALKQNNDKGIRYAGLSAVYLDKQGILFDIDVHGHHPGFHRMGGEMPPMPPMPPIPQISEDAFPVSINGANTHINIDVDMLNEEIERSMRSVEHVFSREWEKLHELSASKRELEWEIRDLDRRQRDIEFSLRRAGEKEKKALEKNAKDIKKERENLDKKLSNVSEDLRELQAKKEQAEKARRENHEKNLKAFYQRFESTVSDILCRYGGGLKSLPDSENVTFRIKRIASAEGDKRGQTKDKVYVFPKKTMTRCLSNKIPPNEFVGEGSSYVF